MDTSLEQALNGRYDLIQEIGRGGMAVVYLANDVRHQRRVAIKVLHPELAAVIGPDRFLAEIRITARLQHPNLLPLFDSGEANGVPYYVMPYVEGESLRAKLERERQLPVAEAVGLATRIASALDHAHHENVVHRDLKPENILLRDGEPLIADFGIALAVSNAGGNRLTQTGLSVGTPQYMSPEQAAAERSIDGRTDIYALGAVLYEMLTGEPPHNGPTAQAVLARVVGERARSTRVTRPAIPEYVDAAVLKALEKVPADRWSTGREMSAALSGANDTPAAFRVNRAVSWRSTAAVAAAALVVGAGVTYAIMARGNRGEPLSYRYVLTLPDSAAVATGQGGSGTDIAISRDGRTVAYVAGPASGGEVTHGIWTRALDSLTPQPIPGATSGTLVRFSPDGSRILYTVGNRMQVMPVAGGAATTICRNASSYDWIDSRRVVFSRGSTLVFWMLQGGPAVDLWITSVDDTTPRRLTQLDSTGAIRRVAFPNVLPGGERALVTIWKAQGADMIAQLAVVSLRDGKLTELGIAGSNPRYSLGHILFVKDDGSLHAVAFDAGKSRVSGEARALGPRVLVKLSGVADYDVSDNGTLVYLGGSDFHRRLVAVERNGVAKPLLSELRRYYTPRVSPDGKHIAVEVGNMHGWDIWSYDVASRTFGPLTRDGSSARPGSWTPDGASLALLKLKPGGFRAFVESSDGSGTTRPLAPWLGGVVDVSYGGRTVAVETSVGQIEMPGVDSSTPRVIVPATARPGVMRLSGDGQLLAYEARTTDPYEIVARSVSGGSQIQVSSGGGTEPLWSRAGDQVFYRGGPFLIAATISRNPLRIIRRDTLFRDTFMRGVLATDYDVLPDGRFVMIQNENPDVHPTVVVNWLRKR